MIGHRRSLSADFSLTAAAQIAAAGSRTVFFVIVARSAAPGVLADASSVIALGTLLALVSAAGTGPAATRSLAGLGSRISPTQAGAIVRRGFADSVVGLIVGASIAGLVYTAIGEAWSAWNVALFTITYGLYQYLRAVDYGLGLVPAYLRTELVANLLVIVLAPLVLFRVSLALVPFFCAYLVFVLIAGRRIRGRISGRSVAAPSGAPREFRAYAMINAIGTAASMAGLQLSVVLAARVLPSQEAGDYAAAFALLIPVLYLPRALATALLPAAASEQAQQPEAVRRTLSTLTSLAMLAALPIAVCGALFPREILIVVSGGRYAGGAVALRLLLLSAFFLVISVPAVNVLSASSVRNLWIPFWASFAGLAVGVVTWAITVPDGKGAGGIAMGVLAGSAVKSLIPLFVCLRRYNLDFRPAIGAAAVVLFAAVAPFRYSWVTGLVIVMACLAAGVVERSRRSMVIRKTA